MAAAAARARRGKAGFWVASERELRAGKVTDVYFVRTVEALRAAGKARVRAVAELTSGALPRGWPWAVMAGVDEAAALLEGHPLDLWALPEGTLFPAEDRAGVRLPAMVLDGPYADYAPFETALLGLVCQASGVATQAARFKALAGPTSVLSFGVRRMHPAIAPMIDRAAYIGGCDAVSCVLSAEMLGLVPQGTMPHALMLAVGDLAEAWRAYDEVLGPKVRRIVLCDTFQDEKAEALLAAEVLGARLAGVRLDTPSSRRGDMAAIVREVRWELAARGRGDVEVVVSGGVREADVGPLLRAGAAGLGIGTSISNAPAVNFAMDLVEVEGRARAKRGKFAGRKMAWRCGACGAWACALATSPAPACPACGATMSKALVQVLKGGRRVRKPASPAALRRSVLRQLAALPAAWGVVPAGP